MRDPGTTGDGDVWPHGRWRTVLVVVHYHFLDLCAGLALPLARFLQGGWRSKRVIEKEFTMPEKPELVEIL